ncbi:hypothetical protein PTKIN_Ptkin04bG0161600 [Pterospermum kingtungense]
MVTALATYVQIWCISYKGPVFTSAFSPLCAVNVAIFSAIAFAERLHVGSLVGAFLIILGLYIVLWGKSSDNFVTANWKDESYLNGGRSKLEVSENDCQTTSDKSTASEVIR